MYLRKSNPFKVGDKIVIKGFYINEFNNIKGIVTKRREKNCVIAFKNQKNFLISSSYLTPLKTKADKIILIDKDRYDKINPYLFYFRKYWLKKDKFNKKDVKLLNKEVKRRNKEYPKTYLKIFYELKLSQLDDYVNGISKRISVFKVIQIHIFKQPYLIKTNIKSKIKLNNYEDIQEVRISG